MSFILQHFQPAFCFCDCFLLIVRLTHSFVPSAVRCSIKMSITLMDPGQAMLMADVDIPAMSPGAQGNGFMQGHIHETALGAQYYSLASCDFIKSLMYCSSDHSDIKPGQSL